MSSIFIGVVKVRYVLGRVAQIIVEDTSEMPLRKSGEIFSREF